MLQESKFIPTPVNNSTNVNTVQNLYGATSYSTGLAIRLVSGVEREGGKNQKYVQSFPVWLSGEIFFLPQ